MGQAAHTVHAACARGKNHQTTHASCGCCRCQDEADKARLEAELALRVAAEAAAEADQVRKELREALRAAAAAEAKLAAFSPATHANGDVAAPHPVANGHATGIEDAAETASADALRAENEELREQLRGVDKRIAGAAVVQARPGVGPAHFLGLRTRWRIISMHTDRPIGCSAGV